MLEHDPILIGLDGGGTSCRAALLVAGRRVEVAGGPANVSDFDGALGRINDVLAQLLAKAGLDRAALSRARAHLGLAGVMGREMAASVAARLPIAQVSVTDDQPTTIAGALGGADGIVAAIGTGSFVGCQNGDDIRVLGGWGFALGDQASGAWLGRRLMSETLLAQDGLSAETDLTRLVVNELGQGAGLVKFALSASPADYATYAPHVLKLAGQGDQLARSLLAEGADYIVRALAVLGYRPGIKLCLTGGLGPSYAPWLPQALAADIAAPIGSALDGALALAARRVDGAP